MSITKRYDFVFLFDVKDGNPNGDPDAGNLPRVDPETGMGLVTDVCLKRKVRNYLLLTKEGKAPFDIYVKEKAVLGRAHFSTFSELGIALGEGAKKQIPKSLEEAFEEFSLPDGLSLEEDEEGVSLVIAADADAKLIKQAIKEAKPGNDLKKFLDDALKGVKSRKPTAVETDRGRDWMCRNYFDIRTFGAVMSLKSAPNCGQVRGPVQMTFARSLDPIVALEHSITRMAVATEAEAEKQGGDNRTMGRKFTVPYGLYRSHGFISAHLAAQTGFSEEDLRLYWQALVNGFENDRSAARGEMSTRLVLAFEHSTALGNAPAHSLFDRVSAKRKSGSTGPVRSIEDYELAFDGKPLPPVDSVKELENGIKMIRIA